jgi:hypothetical protein
VEGHEVVSVGSRTQESADAFGNKFNVPYRHPSYQALVNDPDVDAVYVATHHPMHRRDAELAMAKGKAVLCEKPLAMTYADALSMVECSRENNVLFMEAMWARFLPHMIRVKEIVASGVLGEIISVQADHGQWFEQDPEFRLFKPELGGGALFDLGIYPVSFASMIFGEPASITAKATKAFTGVDGQTSIILQYNSGAHAILNTTNLAANLAATLVKDPADLKVLATYQGAELERSTYTRPFDLVEIPDSHFVILADYVTIEDGTGLVHQAPAFGADDLLTCRKYGLPVVNPVAPDGTFLPDIKDVGGLFFKDADKPLIKDLKNRGLLFKHLQYEHSYPHCWRCHTVLIYYAQPSWYIKTTQIKESLLRENEKTNWQPETIKTGRFGDWLNNNIDWAVSRNRYWGTPLPIWRCSNKHEICIGSLAELSSLSGQELSGTDPHRPFVDDIHFACADCGEGMDRVSEVIDCWYDSGSMPFAQWG